MKTRLSFALAILFLLAVFAATANAQESSAVSFDTSHLVLEQGQTISTIVSLQNISDEKKCFYLKTSTSSYSDIEANLPEGLKKICLNAGESTKFSLAIRAFDDAANDSYTATLKGNDGNNTVSESIEVEVAEDTKSIDLIAYQKSVCRNSYNQSVSVLVKNNSGEMQTIKLSTESELFLPYFEPNDIELDSGEQRFVELKLNVNKTTAFGAYSIPIFARTSEKYFESKAEFDVIECEAPKKRILELSLQSECVSIEKGKNRIVSFRVKNISEEFQTVSLASTGDLPSDLSRKTTVIEPNGSISADLNIHAENASSGTHYIGVWAWNDSDRVAGQFCIEIGKSHAIEVEQLNNNVSIPRDEAEIIAFEIRNAGDFTENVSVTISNSNPNVTITTQSPTIRLASMETKSAFVVISPNLNASLGQKEATVSFSASGKTITKKINFIVEQETQRQKLNVIKAIQYPEKIVAKEGGKTNYYLTLENPTNERITGLSVVVSGLPASIKASAIIGTSLNPKERKTVSGTIEFGKGTKGEYNPQFEIKNSAYKTIVPFAITVKEEKEAGTLAGLWGAASSIALGLIAIAIIVLLAALLSSNNIARKKEHAWLAQEKSEQPKELWQNPLAKP